VANDIKLLNQDQKENLVLSNMNWAQFFNVKKFKKENKMVVLDDYKLTPEKLLGYGKQVTETREHMRYKAL
jgi:hypothetical protein